MRLTGSTGDAVTDGRGDVINVFAASSSLIRRPSRVGIEDENDRRASGFYSPFGSRKLKTIDVEMENQKQRLKFRSN